MALAGAVGPEAASRSQAEDRWESQGAGYHVGSYAVVVLETTVLVTTGRVSGPLWFDLMGAGSLIVSILVGAEVILRVGSSRRGSQEAFIEGAGNR